MNAVGRRRCLALLAGLPLAAPAAAAAGTVRDEAWHDAVRARRLPVRLRVPAGDAAVPLVIFSHGLGGSVDAGTLWAEAWARAGIATLHLQHPGSDTEVLRRGMRALRAAADGEQLIARAGDVRFVLDELDRRRREGASTDLARLRLDAIGLAGHSFGAHTTLALAGQTLGWAGRVALGDARPIAFAAFSPSPPRAGDAAEALREVRRPMLCLTGSLDGDPLGLGGQGQVPERAHSGSYRRAVYDGLPAGAKAELWLDGADHMSFGGHEVGRAMLLLRRREAAPVEQQVRHRALVQDTTTRWWRAHLLGDAAARESLAHPPPGLQAGDAWRRG